MQYIEINIGQLPYIEIHIRQLRAYYTLIGRRRVQYCIYFVEAKILVEGAARDQYFWPRQNKYNIGQGGVQINVLLYPNNVPPLEVEHLSLRMPTKINSMIDVS